MLYTLEATTPLEQIFVKALQDNLYAADFYQQLSQSTLFILSESSTEAPEAGEGAMAIGIMQWHVPLEDGSDHPFTPIFTSQTAVDKAIELMKSEGTAHHGVMTLDAETLFQVLLQSGSDMALNPNSNMSKSLDAHEVRLMLSSQLELVEHRGALSLFGNIKPHEYPHFAQLKGLLSNYKTVEKAYLLESSRLDFIRSTSDHALSLVIQLPAENSEDINRIRGDLKLLERQLGQDSWPIKVHHLHGDSVEPIATFCQAKGVPFYSRSLLTSIKGWFK